MDVERHRLGRHAHGLDRRRGRQPEGLLDGRHRAALAGERVGQVAGDRLHEAGDVRHGLVARQGEADARALHRHGRERADVAVEAVRHQPLHHLEGHAGEPGADEANRHEVLGDQRQAVLAAELVAEADARVKLGLHAGQFVGEMELGRGDRRPQRRRLQRPREHERAADGADLAPHGLVGHQQRPAAGAEALRERRRHHHPGVHGAVVEGEAAAMPADPAHAVGVVDVQPKLFVPVEQGPQRMHRGAIAVHAVDAVDHVPDLAVVAREGLDARLEQVEPVVAQELHRHAVGAGVVDGHLDGRVDLLIQDHGVLVPDEDGNRRRMGQRRARRHQGLQAEDLAEQGLQLGVKRRRDVGPRRRELRAVPAQGVDRPLLKPGVRLQAHVAARPELQQLLPAQRDRAAREVLVFGGPQHQAALRSAGEHLVSGVMNIVMLAHFLTLPTQPLQGCFYRNKQASVLGTH
ncbi:hypothetical protein D3C72_727760 [compost metagenome]